MATGSYLVLDDLGNAGLEKNEQRNAVHGRNFVCNSSIKLSVSTSSASVYTVKAASMTVVGFVPPPKRTSGFRQVEMRRRPAHLPLGAACRL